MTSETVDAQSVLSEGTVTLPSGRVLDVTRSRWAGVLDEEEYDYCRAHGIGLSYDCVQTGWVTQSCSDDATEVLLDPLPSDGVAAVADVDPEDRAIELRSVVDAEAVRVLAEVQQGRMSPDEAELHLAGVVAVAMDELANELSLSDSDHAHWALEVAAADGLRGTRKPASRPIERSEAPLFAFRPWTPEDAPVYLELLGNPKVWEYLPDPYPSEFTLDTARTLIEVGAIGFHHETVAIEVGGRPIGQCLLRFDPEFAGTRAAEVAYWLGEEHWHQGWMSRVLPVFTRRCFRSHGVGVIYAWIMQDNVGSIRVAEGAGYRRDPFPLEAQLAESIRRPGFIRYATHRAEWELDALDS
jgi:RimJ/RimL family protein N-acetyltransferase